MQLVCVYIHDYKVIKDLLFPFDSAFNVTFDGEYLTINKQFKDTDYYKGINISAVMGRNGAGKSTLFEFLEASYFWDESLGFTVWYDRDGEKYHVCDMGYGIRAENIDFDKEFVLENESQKFLARNSVNLVKLNNICDFSKSFFPIKRSKNKLISDCSLSRYQGGSKQVARKKISELLRFFASSYEIFGNQRPRVEYTFHFRSSPVTFLNKFFRNEVGYEKYDLKDTDIEKIRSFKVFLAEIPYSDMSKIFKSEVNIFNYLYDLNIINIISSVVSSSVVRKSDREEMAISIVLMYIDQDVDAQKVGDLARRFSERNLHDSAINDMDYFVCGKLFDDAVKSIHDVASCIQSYRNHYYMRFENSISTDDLGLIFELSSLIQGMPVQLQRSFNFGWEGLSTGEFAKISLFSELYSYEKNITDENAKHIVVIDEADLYLHPEWQRTFLSELLVFVTNVFKKNEVQIILSSHSPIIISDFLPEDIVSMVREDGGAPKVETAIGFGAQITDLFIDGMHLSSTFGEHSRKYLQDIQERSVGGRLREVDIQRINKIPNKNVRTMLLRDYDKNRT